MYEYKLIMCWSNGKWTDGTYKTDKPCTDKEVKNAMTALYTINQANQQKDKRDVKGKINNKYIFYTYVCRKFSNE